MSARQSRVSAMSDFNSTYSENDENKPPEKRLTAFEKLSRDLSNDQKCLKEITLGKRIAFYRIRGQLGTGNFSQVKMGIHALTREKVAIKILDKTKLDQKTQRLLSREISSMEKLHHPNVIRLYEVVETLAKLHMVMEYANGGELFNKISNEGKLPESEAKSVFAQVMAAVQHMHEHQIIHRDLKAENVFYAGTKLIKVGDFGFSTVSRPDQTLNTFCGSPPYAAPELFKDESYYGTYVDIWALGIMLYFMVTGIMPFRAETVGKLKKVILDGYYSIPMYLSEPCQDLIKSVLQQTPIDRLTVGKIIEHKWLENQEFPEALEEYNLNPALDDNGNLKDEEVQARNMLRELGINQDHIKQAHGKESRSCITGTYRIILHRLQKKKLGYYDILEQEQNHSSQNGNSGTKSTNSKNGKSKLCTIL
ncbi:unnamed protein product [Owenia fusiformis]|uniref:Serine/threonine-protein kinase NIM1 n=1 Tax=Owenia fusiformis TaxID=6347 RepID=A0A8J1U9C6_OWEFU|nr:unnamed protein product [Owenia fusiformis]